MQRHLQSSLSSLGPESISLIAFLMICTLALIFSALNSWTTTPLRLLAIFGPLAMAATLGISLFQQSAFLFESQVVVFIALGVAGAAMATVTNSTRVIWLLFAVQCFSAWLLLWFSLAFENTNLF